MNIDRHSILKAMTPDEQCLYLSAVRLELHALCRQIVLDGRDPFIVAEALLEKVARDLREAQELYEAALEGKP